MVKETKITKDMVIKEMISKYPETMVVFAKYNVGCVGCFAASFERIEDIAKVHGIDIETLLKDLNEVIKR